ncbi:MAG TPA: phage terminase large subunit [bacterium]|nr:phage terminase large subunit [bacterium]
MNEVRFETTPIFDWTYNSAKPIVIHQGGTGSGKTYGIDQYLLIRAIEARNTITIVGQDVPNLRGGALRDMQTIIKGNEWLKNYIVDYNATNREYHFTNGSIIEFKSFDDPQDAHSGKRDYSFFNEANGIPFSVFDEIYVRTTKQTIIDYNPTNEFWAHEMIRDMQAGKRNDVDLFISNFTHNRFLPPAIVEKILSYKVTNPNRWLVYGLGKTGTIEGLIFPDLQVVDAFPKDAERVAYGLDFGFTNDPTVLIRSTVLDGMIIADQMIYETRLDNPAIARRLKELGLAGELIYCDSAEPKSIKELRDLGCNVVEAVKGAGSINWGLSHLKSYRGGYAVTARSSEMRHELRNYSNKYDKFTNRYTNDPEDKFNHCADAWRYSQSGILHPTSANFGTAEDDE